MDCLDNENVCSVRKENNTGYYRIHTIWRDDRFRLNVTSRNGAWTGEMTPDNIDKMCKELNIDRDKYLSECREALTTNNGKPDYSYAVEYGTFVWKKTIDRDCGIKLKMGSVVLRHVDFVDTIQGMVEASLKCSQNLKEQLSSVTQQNESNLHRVYQLQDKLDELTNIKIQMETDLYKKFLLLLNTKKRKIQELEEMLGKSKDNSNLGNKGAKDRQTQTEVCDEVVHPFDMETDDNDGNEECEPSDIPSTSQHIKHADKKMQITNDNSSKEINRVECDMVQEICSGLPDESSCGQIEKRTLPSTKVGLLDYFFGAKDSD